jgi:hypothetical protein
MTPENGFRTVIAGGTFPALIWGRFAKGALLRLPAAPFVTPLGAQVSIPWDRHRDCRANKWTPKAHVEMRTFVGGKEPKAECGDPTGPAATVVPALLGADDDYALETLGHQGFLVKTVKVYNLRYPAGAVVGQQPPAGTTVEPGAVVTLSLATAEAVPVTVPSVLGLDAEAAQRTLIAAGLVPEVVVEPSCTGGASCQQRLAADAGRVWRQDVVGGTKRLAGSTVVVAVGPRQG